MTISVKGLLGVFLIKDIALEEPSYSLGFGVEILN